MRGVWWKAPTSRDLLVVNAVRVDVHARVSRKAAERDHGAARPDERECPLPSIHRPGRLEHHVGAFRLGADRAEGRSERAPLLARADTERHAAGVGDARTQHQPDRPEADDRDPVPALHASHLDSVEAARERLGHRGELGRDTGRNRYEVPGGDALWYEEQLGIGAVE